MSDTKTDGKVRMLADGVPLHRVARTLGRSPCAVHSSLYRLLRGDLAASERVKAELEAGALERARALHMAGASQAQICHRLTVEGHAPRGGRWHRTTVARMLQPADE